MRISPIRARADDEFSSRRASYLCRSHLRASEGGSRDLRSKDKDTTMPELLIDFITSLDGYASADGWPGWWGLEGPEYLGWLEASPEADYTVLMGATTYRTMSGFAAEGEHGTE